MQLGLGPWATRESCRWKTLRADMERIWAVREALLAADMREVTPARPKPAPDRSYTAMSGQLFVVRGGERKTVGNCRVEQSCPDEAGADSFLDVAPDLCVSFKVTSDPDWGLWFARFRAPD